MLVTGASGFVGRRLAERLVLECGATVRVVVRAVGRAASLSRLPVELAIADLCDRAAVQAAAKDCNLVFHCARGTDGPPAKRREVDVEGTRNLLEAAWRAGAERFVHTSTVVVYDIPPDGMLDERSRRGGVRDLYADAKREGERIAFEYAQRLPVTIVQPTVVYGPHAGVHGRDVIEELRSTRIPLVDGGLGICNALYVDDLVTALLLAATSDRAPGEAFLVSGPEHPTWADFYGAFERMLGVRHTVSMSEAEAIAHWKRSSRRTWLAPEALRAVRGNAELRRDLLATREGAVIRRVAERVLPASFFAPERWPAAGADPPTFNPEPPPLVPFKPQVVRFLASTAQVRIDKARSLLGYHPVFGLEEGMRLTEAWARWEGLLPPENR